MGTYDLEKEIHHILQDSSKIRDYNAKLQSEYMKAQGCVTVLQDRSETVQKTDLCNLQSENLGQVFGQSYQSNSILEKLIKHYLEIQ